jgi:hypothetical protein
MTPRQRHYLRQGLVWGVVLLALLAVFTLYARPDFLKSMADQLWACF